jgi:TrmH family RNA methyltransferase
MYSPNIVRSSVGCLFTNQIATGTTTEIIAFLKVNFYCATLQNAIPYHTQISQHLLLLLEPKLLV